MDPTALATVGGFFLTILVLIGSLAWRGSARLTSIEITLKNADEKASTSARAALKAADKAEAAHAEIIELTHAIDNLPCHACTVTAPARWPMR